MRSYTDKEQSVQNYTDVITHLSPLPKNLGRGE